MTIGNPVSPIGSFTDPEYAQVGLTEAKARKTHDVETAMMRFDSTTRTIIDGHKIGFCKLIVDREISQDIRLPRSRRAGSGDHTGGGDRHRRRHAGR